jgi:electron transport complex protein RnfB
LKKDIYEQLAKYLDDMPGGYPSTESGVEQRILRRLFTPEEARLALRLTLLPQEPARIAKHLHRSPEETARKLEDMAKKGLIYRSQPKDGPPRYMAWQFAIGIWEFHVNALDQDLVRDMEEYIPRLLNFETWKKVPQLRTIPIGQTIPVEHKILPHEMAEEIVRSQRKILVAPCICRRERKIAGQGCEKLEESCLVFGSGTDYYLKNGLGRMIDPCGSSKRPIETGWSCSRAILKKWGASAVAAAVVAESSGRSSSIPNRPALSLPRSGCFIAKRHARDAASASTDARWKP